MPDDNARGYGSRWAALAGILTAGAGMLVLLGWWLQRAAFLHLIQPSPSAVPMSRSAAVCFVFCGAGLTLLTRRRAGTGWGLAFAAGPALLATLTLRDYVFRTDSGINNIFGPASMPGVGAFSGRISPLACICFLLTALALGAIDLGPPSAAWPGWTAATAATFTWPIAWTGLLSEYFGIATAIGPFHTAPMSPYAGLCFLMLSGGVLAQAWHSDPGRVAPGRRLAPRWAPYFIAIGSTFSMLWLMNEETARLGARPALIVFAETVLTLLVVVSVPMEFRPRIATGLVVAVVIILFTELYSFRALWKNDESQAWVVHTQRVLTQIDVLAEELAEAEAACRGFMWTGEQPALEMWNKGIRKFQNDLLVLGSEVADNQRQNHKVAEIHIALAQTIASIEARIQAQQLHGRQAALDDFRRHEGWRVLDAVETRLNTMRKEENRLLAIRIAAAEENSRQTKLVVILGNAVAILFLVVLGGIGTLEMRGVVKEKTFRGLLESAPDAMVVTDSRGLIILVNAQTERMFGYAREELLHKPVEMLMAERFRARNTGFGQHVFQPERSSAEGAVELYGLHHNGNEFPVELRLSPLETERGRLISGAFRDITEHRRIEQRLKSLATALSQQAALLDVVPDCIMVRDLQGVISFWNRGAEMTYGFTRKEALGKISHELLQTQFPVPEAEITAALTGSGRWKGELNHRRKDGSRLCVASRWVLEHAGPDTLLRVLEINSDITAQKESDDEIRRLNAELESRINELTAINHELEAFTYTAAHDLRAPLRHMHGFAGFLRSSWYEKLDEDGRHCLDKIAASSRGMGQLLDDLLNFSRLGRVELQMNRVNLSRLVEQIRQELEPEVKGRSLTWDVAELPEVAGDMSLLHQLLYNLIANAVKYTNKCPQAHIEIGSQPDAGENVTVFVRDNGVGFQMEYADKLFGVFQRLHKSQDFEGTGIGLAIVRRIVERHGGRAWAEGYPGKGATLYVSLPMKGLNHGQAGLHPAGR